MLFLLEEPMVAEAPAPARETTTRFEPSDEVLMERIQNNDPEALGALHGRYSRLLKSVILKVVFNEAESEDLLQEVFIEIWKRAVSYQPEKGRPLGWIMTLARRRAIDRLRKRDAYGRMETHVAETARVEAREAVAYVEEEIAQSEVRAILQRALADLPEAQREAIDFVYYKGMSQREMSTRSGIPLGTIKTRLELGLKKLTKGLEGLTDLL